MLKAIGTGWSAGVKWTDMEVLHGEGGGPIVNVSGRVKDLMDLKGVKQILLAIPMMKDMPWPRWCWSGRRRDMHECGHELTAIES